jgi:hypothetical protein
MKGRQLEESITPTPAADPETKPEGAEEQFSSSSASGGEGEEEEDATSN